MLNNYYTPKYIYVTKPWLSWTFHVLRITLLIYIICFNIIYKQGYQATDEFVGSVTSKVKGIAMDKNGSLYDAVDLVNPAQETGALFVATRISKTTGQQLTQCAGNSDSESPPAHRSELCNSDNTCPSGIITANGVTTGKCIHDPYKDGHNYCEITGWCPLESDPDETNILEEVGNFTIFIRGDGYFPSLAPNHRYSTFADEELLWNYNLFYLSDIICSALTENPLPLSSDPSIPPERCDTNYYKRVASYGAVIMVDIEYNCNLDHNYERCSPVFTFKRVDKNNDNTSGFNFRDVNYYYINDNKNSTNARRDLIKYNGIKFLFNIHGEGRRFDFLVLTVTIGSGVGLLGIASYLCDTLLVTISKDKEIIQKKKYELVTSNEIKTPFFNIPTATYVHDSRI